MRPNRRQPNARMAGLVSVNPRRAYWAPPPGANPEGTLLKGMARRPRRRRAIRPVRNVRVSQTPVAITILMRCTYGPNVFRRAIDSIVAQKHAEWRLVIAYEDDQCLEYLRTLRLTQPVTLVKGGPQSPNAQSNSYNMTMDPLVRTVKTGFLILLDDVDRFATPNALGDIVSALGVHSTVVTWPRQPLPGSSVRSRPPFGYCVHSSYAQRSAWPCTPDGEVKFVSGVFQQPGVRVRRLNGQKVLYGVNSAPKGVAVPKHAALRTAAPKPAAHKPASPKPAAPKPAALKPGRSQALRPGVQKSRPSSSDALSVPRALTPYQIKVLNKRPYDFSEISTLRPEVLDTVYDNIRAFDEIVGRYKRILFICGDHPGYGGAATNCSRLQQHYKQLGHDTFAFYYNFTKGGDVMFQRGPDFIIDDLRRLDTISFRPDLIILKSFVNADLRTFKCPVFYLVGGIYNSRLNEYHDSLHTKAAHDRHINTEVLSQIRRSDFSFANSAHTQDILRRYYRLDTALFYSTFVEYVGKPPPIVSDLGKRRYKYGLIVSNFGRKIKNVAKSVAFLRNKEDVILIGKNSKLYEPYGFKCVDLVDSEQMAWYYQQIQYIVQDSFYESCSNVRVEAMFNGCEVMSTFSQLNSDKDVDMYLSKLNKNTRSIEIINYTHIEDNVSNLLKSTHSTEFIIIEEDDYLNANIREIPIFVNPSKFKYEKESLYFVYETYFSDAERLDNYVSFLVTTLREIGAANDERRHGFERFVHTYNSLKNVDRGIMFVSFGAGYSEIALDTVRTYRTHTKLPILLYTDSRKVATEPNNIANLHIVLVEAPYNYSRIIKTQAYKYSPFEKTCYVDIDSECLHNFDNVFSYLGTHDLCMQRTMHNVSRRDYVEKASLVRRDQPIGMNVSHAREHLKYFDKLEGESGLGFHSRAKFDVFAGGVVFFSRNSLAAQVFDRVSYFWNKCDRLFDMVGWTMTIATIKPKIHVLATENYNQVDSRIIKSLHWPTAKTDSRFISRFVKKRFHPLSNSWQDADFYNIFLKKTILICYDADGWVFHEIAIVLKRYLSHKYIIVLLNERDACRIPDYDYDLLFVMGLNYFVSHSFRHVPNAKVICGKTSGTWPRRDGAGKGYYDMLKSLKIGYANTRALCSELQQHMSGKVFYLPNGVDTHRFYRSTNFMVNSPVRLSMIASEFRASAKGVKHYLNVIEYLGSRGIQVQDRKIVVVPSGNITPNVELVKHYNDIDIFICLSESETGPQPCFEALACGTVVITTKVGLIQEVVRNDYNGYLIDDRDNIEEVGDTIIKYLSYSHDRKREMSDNCLESVKSYDWKYQVRNYQVMLDHYFGETM